MTARTQPPLVEAAAGGAIGGAGMTPRTRDRDRRYWYGIGAVAVLLVLPLLAWSMGWLIGEVPPETAPAPPPATTQ